MPSSGGNIENIRIDAGIESKEEFKQLVNLLGNKILLEENINKSISNDWFKTKKGKRVADKLGYKGSHFALAQDLSNYRSDLWTKVDIESATEKATERILNFISSNFPKEVDSESEISAENDDHISIQPLSIRSSNLHNSFVGKKYYIKTMGCDAIGELVPGNNIIIKRGSLLRKEITKSYNKNDVLRRNELLGKHCQLTEQGYIALEDFPILSPSAASGIVQGRSSNGLRDWIDEDGRNLGSHIN